MIYVLYLIIIILAVLLQASLLPLIFIEITPNVFLTLVLTFWFILRNRAAVVAAVIGGLFFDLTHSQHLGVTSATVTLLLLAVSLLGQRLEYSRWQVLILYFISSLTTRLVYTFPVDSLDLLLWGIFADLLSFIVVYPAAKAVFWRLRLVPISSLTYSESGGRDSR